jgi:hypothetical protein
MVGSMLHESFYTSAVYINEQIGVYSGAVCHRSSFSDVMPVTNATKDVILLFAGENYVNHDVIVSLKERLHWRWNDCRLSGPPL